MVSKAQIKAQAKYDKGNTKSIHLKFNMKSDADILKKLDSVESKQGYIKELIRKDIESKYILHKCHFDNSGMQLIYEKANEPQDGKWLWWYDNLGNAEYARMKLDAQDHFYPNTKFLVERNVIGWSFERIVKQ